MINLEVNKGVLRLNPSFDQNWINVTTDSVIFNKDTNQQGY